MWPNTDLVGVRDSLRRAERGELYQGAAPSWEERVPARWAQVPPLEKFDLPGEAEVVEQMMAWVGSCVEFFRGDGRRAPNALLVGPSGTGKTTLMWSALRSLHEAGIRSCGSSTAAEIVTAARQIGNGPTPELLTQAATRLVLGLDDLGAQNRTDWTTSVLEMVVNHRYNNLLPTLTTTNLNLLDLVASLDLAFVRRLADSDAGDLVLHLTEYQAGRSA